MKQPYQATFANWGWRGSASFNLLLVRVSNLTFLVGKLHQGLRSLSLVAESPLAGMAVLKSACASGAERCLPESAAGTAEYRRVLLPSDVQ